MDWNPAQYLKFAAPRLRPALDLLARIDHPSPQRVVDLGCGTGQVTQLLAARWPQAAVCGVDGSAEMLARARTEAPALAWQHADLAHWQPDGPPDVLFSNAALHWLPDHPALFTRLLLALAPQGVLAVQMPRNFHAPSHTLIEATARAGPWRARLAPLLRPAPVAEPARYFDWLAPHAAAVDVWETEYLQPLTGPDPVKEWTKGTWLAPLLAALPADEAAAFERDYAARVRAAYPPRADGVTLFPFRRLFIVVRRG